MTTFVLPPEASWAVFGLKFARGCVERPDNNHVAPKAMLTPSDAIAMTRQRIQLPTPNSVPRQFQKRNRDTSALRVDIPGGVGNLSPR